MVFFFLLWIVLRCYGVFCCIRIVSHRCGTRCFSVIVWIPRMWERSCDCDLLLPLSGLVLTNRICALIARYVQVHILVGLWVHLVGIVRYLVGVVWCIIWYYRDIFNIFVPVCPFDSTRETSYFPI